MAYFNYESRDMDFSDVSYGISKSGLEGYFDYLKVNVVDKIKGQLQNIEDVNSAINSGWQGVSRDAFLRQFNNAIYNASNELDMEFGNLRNKLNELAQSYYAQDAKMVEHVEEAMTAFNYGR